MKACHQLAAVVLGCALGSAVPSAQALTLAPGFDTYTLGRNDDGFAGPTPLGFTANFFGKNYTSIYVNNNGNITFGAPSISYTPTGVGAGYTGVPIIAPFFADVDTRGFASGMVTYGTGTYNGHPSFGVNFPAVGYFNEETDKLNTFQVILTERSDVAPGNFDIFFNYQKIQWETGDQSGGHDGLGGTSAAVGYSNGSGLPGTYYEVPGSLVNGAFVDGGPMSLVGHSNNGTPGEFQYKVRNGAVMSPVPLPGAAPMFGGAIAALGFIGYRLRKKPATVA